MGAQLALDDVHVGEEVGPLPTLLVCARPEPVQVIVLPTHCSLEHQVQIFETEVAADHNPAPHPGFNELHLDMQRQRLGLFRRRREVDGLDALTKQA